MRNLFISVTKASFNTYELKPGTIVKFSVIENADSPYENKEKLRIENTGIIDEIDTDKISIIVNPETNKIINCEGNPILDQASISSERYLNMFKPAVGCGFDDHGTVKPLTFNTHLITMKPDWANQLSLKLGFLNEHGYDPRSFVRTYYWK